MSLITKINSRYKTVIMFLIATISIIILLVVAFYTSIERIIYEDYYNTLQHKNETIAQLYLQADQESSTNTEINYKFDSNKSYILNVSKDNYVAISDSFQLPPNLLLKIITQGEIIFQNDSLILTGKQFKNAQKSFVVISSSENYFKKHIQVQLQKILIFCFILAVIIAVLVSFFLSKNLYKPISKITNKVKEISSLNLNSRLDEERYNKELNHLINTFNEMLNRIETAFESQNNFISNASHELRTPLTSIIGFADVSLSKTRSQEEYEDTLNIILKEAEKLESKTKALLSLAQTGFKGGAQKFELVRIDELLWDCITTIQTLNQNSKPLFDTSLLPDNSFKLRVKGNRQLLLLAFSNIIMNGCKYSNNQTVKISVGATNTHVIIIVKDAGIGIPKEEMQYIFDPFYRASNTKKFEGYGIGLPLTKNILKMHQGTINILTADTGGTIVEVHLPIAPL